jgi:hypothetical protein
LQEPGARLGSRRVQVGSDCAGFQVPDGLRELVLHDCFDAATLDALADDPAGKPGRASLNFRITGYILHVMQAQAPPLLPLLRSRLQAELLTLVLLTPGREWTLTELANRGRRVVVLCPA